MQNKSLLGPRNCLQAKPHSQTATRQFILLSTFVNGQEPHMTAHQNADILKQKGAI